MNYKLIAGFLLLFNLQAVSQQKPAYVLFDSVGHQIGYQEMIDQLVQADIILFGELHGNPIAHWLEYELARDLQQKNKLILGAEMFVASDQDAIDSYLQSEISIDQLDSLANLWSNFKTDYAPLIKLAKKEELPFIATNVPREYANRVFKKGFDTLDSLSSENKKWIAPLPIPLDTSLSMYQKILQMSGTHGSINTVKAQALKDATMAHFILKNYQEGHLFIHFNGRYHSDRYQGILWYLRQQNDNLKYSTISTVTQTEVNKLDADHKHRASYIICIDNDIKNSF